MSLPTTSKNMFTTSKNCHALDPIQRLVVGPRVNLTKPDGMPTHFYATLAYDVGNSTQIEPEGKIKLVYDNSDNIVCAGVGKRSANLSDYTVAMVNGYAEACLRREFAERARDYTVTVYTKTNYLRRNHVFKDVVEFDRIVNSEATFVIDEITTNVDREVESLRRGLL